MKIERFSFTQVEMLPLPSKPSDPLTALAEFESTGQDVANWLVTEPVKYDAGVTIPAPEDPEVVGTLTVTVVLADALPPDPLQDRLYVSD